MKISPVVRDGVMAVLLFSALGFVLLNTPEKMNPDEKIRLESFVPSEFPEFLPIWKSHTYDTADYKDAWDSINELLVRTYYDERGRRVDLILEYSSDMRKNFSFHFPENCHRSGGNEVHVFEPLDIPLEEGRVMKAKLLFIQGVQGSVEEEDKLTAYWLSIDGRHFHETFWIKVDQFFAGLLRRSHRGFLIRVDFKDGAEQAGEGLEKGRELIRRFVRDLYFAVSPEKRDALFGAFENPGS